MLSINTNLGSLIVQSNLSRSTLGLQQAIDGFKINGAKDNAAGYSIATNMTTKIGAYSVAESNTMMGLDLVNTSVESMNLIVSHLSRIRNLAEQAANGTYGVESLQALQAETNSRLAEISRIFNNTEYNKINLYKEDKPYFLSPVTQLTEEEAIAQGYTIIKTADELQAMQDNLSGKYILMNDIDLSGYDWTPVGNSTQRFQGELNGNGYVVKNLKVGSYGAKTEVGFFGATLNATIQNLGIEDFEVAGSARCAGLAGTVHSTKIINCYTSGNTKVSDNSAGGLIGAIYSSNLTDCYSLGTVEGNMSSGGITGVNMASSYTNCFSMATVKGKSATGGFIGYMRDRQNYITSCYAAGAVIGETKTGGFFGDAESSVMTMTNSYWIKDKTRQEEGCGIASATSTPVGISMIELEDLITAGSLKDYMYTGPNEVVVNLQIGINSDTSSNISVNTGLPFSKLRIDISTPALAGNTLTTIDEYIKQLSAKQTELGSAYNRLESIIESININMENLVSSRSTLRDADIAEESSQYIKMQILQQASATLLATANQSPSIALQLL